MKLNELLNQEKDCKLYPNSNLLVSSTDFVGVEIELEDIDTNRSDYDEISPNNFWNTVSEDSLRGGGELVFKEPLRGLNLIKALEEYTSFLTKYTTIVGNFPTISDRCSLHVHLDVRDLHINEIKNVAAIYVLFEKVIFQFLNPDRYNNNYCVPLGITDFNNIFSEMPSDVHDNSTAYNFTKYIKDRCDKYGSMNYLSTTSYGSLEFRGHPGSFNTMDIIEWVNILLSIKTFAKSLGDKDITAMMVSGWSAEALTNEIFSSVAHLLLQTNCFKQNFIYGKSWLIDTLSMKRLKEKTISSLRNKRTSGKELIDIYRESI